MVCYKKASKVRQIWNSNLLEQNNDYLKKNISVFRNDTILVINKWGLEFDLNTTGAILWNNLNHPQSELDLITVLNEIYPNHKKDNIEYLHKFLNKLQKEKLIQII